MRRDPLAREMAFAFSGLALLLFLDLTTQLVGSVPELLNRLAIVLLLAQPVFTLRLLDRIRPLPARLMPVAYLAEAIALAPLLVLPAEAPGLLALLVLAIVVFLVLEVVAAVYFLAEARRRSGAARVRLVVAGGSTALMATAILILLVAVLGGGSLATFAARVVAVLAAMGYGIAFLPPGFLRRSWQAETSYRLGRRLLESADAADPHGAWHRFVVLAAELTGADAAIVRSADASVRAAVGLEPPPVEPDAVQALLALTNPPLDLPISQAGEPWVSIARLVDARFLTIVPLASPSTSGPAVLSLYSRRRSLFGEDDRELLKALGTQAAILAERAALAADLGKTVEELRSANAAKSDFLASMSHELRTPLNAIIGFSELMRLETPENERVSVPVEWVGHVATAGQHLLDLINDVLDLAKVEAGRLELDRQPFDVDAAASEWVGGVRPLADRKEIRLVTQGRGGTIEADRGRLRQVVYNLLSNAIKFTPPGGEVRLELDRSEHEVSLVVADTGIGIAPQDHEAVFEEFRQVGSPGDRQPGTGLGLALTRRLVQAHGGQIELESALGSGSRFTVRLPQQPEAAVTRRGPAPSEQQAVRSSAAEVLVIEDDPGAVRLLRESLRDTGWRVRAAADGPKGLAAARERRPDAIVLDVLLPGIDGWDVLRTLKADPELRDVPVLMLSVVDEREVGLALGATDYLVKPVERSALLARLGRYTFTTKVRERDVRVLVIDDDPRAVGMIAEVLEQEGFTVERAGGGREGIELARRTPPDVVVCDLVMPDVDGFEVVQALKGDPTTREAAILIVTGHDIGTMDKARLNGDILAVLAKGTDLRDGLRTWLARIERRGAPAAATDDETRAPSPESAPATATEGGAVS